MVTVGKLNYARNEPLVIRLSLSKHRGARPNDKMCPQLYKHMPFRDNFGGEPERRGDEHLHQESRDDEDTQDRRDREEESPQTRQRSTSPHQLLPTSDSAHLRQATAPQVRSCADLCRCNRKGLGRQKELQSTETHRPNTFSARVPN